MAKLVSITEAVEITNNRVKPFSGKRPYLATGDLIGDEINGVASVDYETKPSRADLLVNTGEIIVARMQATNKVLLVGEKTKELIVSTGFLTLVPKKGFDAEYLFHYFGSYIFQREKDKYCSGATQRAINNRGFEKLRVPSYSIDEQKKIAKILRCVETLRQKRTQSLQLLDEFLRATFQDMFSDPIVNTHNYDVVTVADITTNIKDGPHVSPRYVNKGIPILSTRNVRPGELLLEDMKYVSQDIFCELTKRFRPQKGDVLVTKGGTTGYAKVVDFDWPFCVWVHIAVLRPTHDVDSVYLEGAMNSEYCYLQSQRYTHGIANRDLGLTRIAKIKLLKPPKKVQQKYASIVRNHKEIKQKMQQSMTEIDNQFNALIQEVFGEV